MGSRIDITTRTNKDKETGTYEIGSTNCTDVTIPITVIARRDEMVMIR